ncbi:MAG TPA: hypothetical protein VF576_10655 [Rubricoccaceae bacterium]
MLASSRLARAPGHGRCAAALALRAGCASTAPPVSAPTTDADTGARPVALCVVE